MFRKFATIAALTCAALISTSTVYASHRGVFEAHLIGGRVYWYTINFEEIIKKITGKDLKTGTFVQAAIKIQTADSLCSNPQTKVIIPGKGPKGDAFSNKDKVTEDELFKTDRTSGNEYKSTATILDLVPTCPTDPAGGVCRLNPPADLCKNAPGDPSQWHPLFWQDRGCNKEGSPNNIGGQNFCYELYAAFVNGTLTYVTGGPNFVGAPVTTNTLLSDWTFVYLPTTFKFKVDLLIGGYIETIYGSCSFPVNPSNGQTYSITNPPANGWGHLLPNGENVNYACSPIEPGAYQ